MKNKKLKISLLLSTCFLAYSFIFNSCVDPIVPEFDFKDNVLFIDGYALSEPGLSSVSIKRSVFQNESYSVFDLNNAIVQFENNQTGEIITCPQEGDGKYYPPTDFKVNDGEEWKLKIQLEDGQQYESEVETVTNVVPIDNVNSEFSEQLYFDDGVGNFVPGHSLSIDWKDPEGVSNAYLWRYRSFEPLIVCNSCPNRQRFRGGKCITNPSGTGWWGEADYLCTTECWQIRYNEKFRILDDKLIDGQNITNQKIINLPFYRRQNVLVEIQQLSLSNSAYDYYKIIDDISNESGGLNAPPPAALNGNIFNINDQSDPVLGQFVVAGTATKTVFLDREDLGVTAITPDGPVRLELCGTPCPDSLIYYPCFEGTFRTAIEPEDWPQ